jgi:hypothetical protein
VFSNHLKEFFMRKILVAFLAVLLTGAVAPMVTQVASAQVAASPDQTGTLTGKVVDANGNPVSGAMVNVMLIPNKGQWQRGRTKPNQVQPGQTVWIKRTMVRGITKTADDGTFTINNAPVGKYRIFVFDRGVGMGRVQKPVAVASGTTGDAGTITLQKGRPGRGGRRGN